MKRKQGEYTTHNGNYQFFRMKVIHTLIWGKIRNRYPRHPGHFNRMSSTEQTLHNRVGSNIYQNMCIEVRDAQLRLCGVK